MTERLAALVVLLAGGGWTDIFTRPLSVALFVIGVAAFAGPPLWTFVRRSLGARTVAPPVPR